MGPGFNEEVLKVLNKSFNQAGKSIIPCMMFMKKKMSKVTKQLKKWKARCGITVQIIIYVGTL